MKRMILAATTVVALAATPAFAGSNFSFGFYTPAPVYVAPAPVAYVQPVPVYGQGYWQPGYYGAPVSYYGYGYGYGRRHHHGHEHGHWR
jgi:hypothetical protein